MSGGLRDVLKALEDAEARYLLIGGVAVVLHGHPRFTADIDLLVDFEPTNLDRINSALKGLGYAPRVPVTLPELADAKLRKRLLEERNMVAMSLWSKQYPATEVDIVFDDPVDFNQAYHRRLQADVYAITVDVLSLDDLMEMKREAGRAKDLEDLRALESIKAVTLG